MRSAARECAISIIAQQLTGISGPGVSASFVYDGLGRREKKTINSSLTEFLFDGVNPVQETSGATILANILPGLEIDEFLIRTEVSSGTTSFFLADALGSSMAVADASGVVQTEYTYEPFGKTTASGASNSSAYQYTGRENDETGLYYYRARYYHPQLQRFISEDPSEFEGGDINLFAYVWNSPLVYIDPSGLSGFGGFRLPKFGPRNPVGESRTNTPSSAPGNPGPVKGQTPRPDVRPASPNDPKQPTRQFQDKLPTGGGWSRPLGVCTWRSRYAGLFGRIYSSRASTLCQVEKILCQIIQFAEQRQSYVQILGLRVGVDTHE
jgi:RHS repeat-associated protein